jgi:hypothetical protein
MRGFFGALFGGAFGLAAIALYIGGFVGWCWWMWVAIQLGSFWMFVFGLAGPFAMIAALLGLWSLLFGIPLWLLHLVH